MDKKIARNFSRLELADYLADLSDQLRRGTITAQDRVWTVPAEVAAKIHFKEEEGCLVAKLSLRWPLKGERRPGAPGKPEARSTAQKQAQASWKAVKEGLADGFKEIQRLAKLDLLPEEQTLADFVENSRRLAQLAPPEWRQSLEEYLAHLEAFAGAVHRRELQTALKELEALKTSMNACHREFK
jgi:XXXCH domain-containing protein